MYKIVISWHSEVQRGRRKLSLLVASSHLRFAAIEDSQRNMVNGRAWTQAEDTACMKAFVIVSEDAEKGVRQSRADFMKRYSRSSAGSEWRIIRSITPLAYVPLALPSQYSRGTS
jgi:hypothetical protein